jgi:hypothetical protein
MRENGNIVDCGDGKLRRTNWTSLAQRPPSTTPRSKRERVRRRRREFGRGGTVDGRAATCRWTKLGVGLNDVLNGVSYTFAGRGRDSGGYNGDSAPRGIPRFLQANKGRGKQSIPTVLGLRLGDGSFGSPGLGFPGRK